MAALIRIVLIVCSFLIPSIASARDVRLALLVAHQEGWKGEPRLKYAINGDLLPMLQTMQEIGFEVKSLMNPSSDRLRQAFRWVRWRLTQRPYVKTFLFYYSGHADRHFMHLGPKKKSPVSYKEFSNFLRSLKIQRRIAIFDSCYSGELIRQFGSLGQYKKLLRKGLAKGVKRKRAFDISLLAKKQKGVERGVRILSSSLGVAWEIHRYRSSVFTYHLLRGLKGKADLDRNGKITLDELFEFSSQSVRQDTGQTPEQLTLVQRQSAYAFAPAYQSRLRIGPDVVGKIKISVSNFVWSQEKRRKAPLHLSVMSGKGVVELHRDQLCWRQDLQFPLAGEVHLGSNWTSIPCQRLAMVQKGSVHMPARLERRKPRIRDWSLAFQANLLAPSLIGNQIPLMGTTLSLHHRFFGIYLGGWATISHFPSGDFLQIFAELRAEGGYRFSFSAIELFFGGFSGLGGVFQDVHLGKKKNASQPRSGLVFRYGLTLAPTYWFTSRIGATLGSDIGFHLMRRVTDLEHVFGWGIRGGLAYTF